MKKLIICFFAIFQLHAISSIAQSRNKNGFVYNRYTKSYERPNFSLSIKTSERFITSINKIWVFSTNDIPGHWRHPRPNEIKSRSALVANYIYPIQNIAYRSPPSAVKVELNMVRENFTLLTKEQADPSITLSSSIGQINVHYADALTLGIILPTGPGFNILVVDSLYIPSAGPFKGAFVCIEHDRRPYLKVIAGTIVYESPTILSLMGSQSGDFIYSFNNLYLKSIYSDLKINELNPAPPITVLPDGLSLNVYPVRTGKLERQLLNRLYIKLMEQCITKLSTTNDTWVSDNLINRFQTYRYTKLLPESLIEDPISQTKLQDIISDFQVNYGTYIIKRLRPLDGFTILANGAIHDLPFQPLRYYALPTTARLLPLMKHGSLGSIRYSGTGDTQLEMSIEVEMGYDSIQFSKINNELRKKGLHLETQLSENIINVVEQPLKMAGRTIGKIIPISSRVLRLEIILDEGTKSIAKLFPKIGHSQFDVQMKVNGETKNFDQRLELDISTKLLDSLSYDQPLKSFYIEERSLLTDQIKVSNNLDSYRQKEKALNFVETLLEFQFADRTIVLGPFRLSAYNTLASEKIIPFIKYNSPFNVVVSGRAVYDDGEIDIRPFVANSTIILLDEAKLNIN